MEFGQLTEHDKRNIYFRKSRRKWGRNTSSKPLYLFEKSFIWGKSKCSAAYFQYNLITLNLEIMLNFDFLEKGAGNSFSTTFCVWILKKNVSHVKFYQLTKFHCLIAFTSLVIGQCLYCNCLFPRLERHKFLN